MGLTSGLTSEFSLVWMRGRSHTEGVHAARSGGLPMHCGVVLERFDVTPQFARDEQEEI